MYTAEVHVCTDTLLDHGIYIADHATHMYEYKQRRHHVMQWAHTAAALALYNLYLLRRCPLQYATFAWLM